MTRQVATSRRNDDIPRLMASQWKIHGTYPWDPWWPWRFRLRPMIVEIFRPWLFSRSRTEWWLGLGKQNREIHNVYPQARCIDFYHPQMARYISGEWKIITYPEKSMLSMGEHRWIFHGHSWMDLWMFILPYGPFIRYPLVNVYITVENHHF